MEAEQGKPPPTGTLCNRRAARPPASAQLAESGETLTDEPSLSSPPQQTQRVLPKSKWTEAGLGASTWKEEEPGSPPRLTHTCQPQAPIQSAAEAVIGGPAGPTPSLTSRAATTGLQSAGRLAQLRGHRQPPGEPGLVPRALRGPVRQPPGAPGCRAPAISLPSPPRPVARELGGPQPVLPECPLTPGGHQPRPLSTPCPSGLTMRRHEGRAGSGGGGAGRGPGRVSDWGARVSGRALEARRRPRPIPAWPTPPCPVAADRRPLFAPHPAPACPSPLASGLD
ncbi:basic proline-rich protein-like [Lepus europaeus]|uniref:basic proline-rich protein-like n=1 Tax=Lepus europaeus TaxID=9983 RepID=UPI002B47519A|nr:basic proline-rich protein-like [Lepus europaeus]